MLFFSKIILCFAKNSNSPSRVGIMAIIFFVLQKEIISFTDIFSNFGQFQNSSTKNFPIHSLFESAPMILIFLLILLVDFLIDFISGIFFDTLVMRILMLSPFLITTYSLTQNQFFLILK